MCLTSTHFANIIFLSSFVKSASLLPLRSSATVSGQMLLMPPFIYECAGKRVGNQFRVTD